MEERQVTGICKFCGQVRALFNVASGLVYDGIIDMLTVNAVDGSTVKMYLDGKADRIEVRRKQTLEI